MVIFTLPFDTENVQKSSQNIMYNENNSNLQVVSYNTSTKLIIEPMYGILWVDMQWYHS